jgi:hypothetical protein
MTVKTETLTLKKRPNRVNMMLRILLWAGIVVVVIGLTLFLSSRIGLFGSVGEMLDYMRLQF